MDDMDHIQDMVSEAQDRLLSERRRRAEAEAAAEVPDERYCNDCGVSIPAARLKARPTATLCVDCQSDREMARG